MSVVQFHPAPPNLGLKAIVGNCAATFKAVWAPVRVRSDPPSLGYTPQGEAADCKSVAEKHAWFDSKVTHQIMQRRTRWGGRRTFNSEMTGSIPVRCTNNASNCLMERQAPDKRPRGSSILPRSTNSRRTTWRWSLASQAGETSSKLVRGTNNVPMV